MNHSYILTFCIIFAERDKKKRKEENKSKAPIQEKPQEAKTEFKPEETPEKKKEKPKSLRTTAPSHAKFRSTGKSIINFGLVNVTFHQLSSLETVAFIDFGWPDYLCLQKDF